MIRRVRHTGNKANISGDTNGPKFYNASVKAPIAITSVFRQNPLNFYIIISPTKLKVN